MSYVLDLSPLPPIFARDEPAARELAQSAANTLGTRVHVYPVRADGTRTDAGKFFVEPCASFASGLKGRGVEGCDPDDLAIAVCAALRDSGIRPRIRFRFHAGLADAADALEVTTQTGAVLASFPLSLTRLPPGLAERLAASIEAAGEALKEIPQ